MGSQRGDEDLFGACRSCMEAQLPSTEMVAKGMVPSSSCWDNLCSESYSGVNTHKALFHFLFMAECIFLLNLDEGFLLQERRLAFLGSGPFYEVEFLLAWHLVAPAAQ